MVALTGAPDAFRPEEIKQEKVEGRKKKEKKRDGSAYGIRTRDLILERDAS